MKQDRTEQHVVWAAVCLVIVTINAWPAFFMDGSPPSLLQEAAAWLILLTEAIYTFSAKVGTADSTSFQKTHKPARCAAAGFLGLEAALLVLLLYVPAPAQTHPLVISFFSFGFFWLGFGWEMVYAPITRAMGRGKNATSQQ
ncbi:hypothetical protein PG997_001470 [Apiospora hydei]|uniref:Uncharacterized protein n=1 Tax=Apiospora hydei TaxID=1337664 RepID=A0ABR1XDQ3_9PEZI